MITDVRKLQPGDVIITNNIIEPPRAHGANFIWPIADQRIEVGEMLVVLKIYEKKVGRMTHVYCDVLHNKTHHKLHLLEFGEINFPKDMLANLYCTRSYTKVF